MAGSTPKAKLSLQQYARFYDGDDRFDLTVDQLNQPETQSLYFKNRTLLLFYQIVVIHGFIRLHRRLKTDVIAALESMNLRDPRRSTLDRNISSGERLTLEEVRADLESMEWHCCRVVSLKTFEFGSSHTSSATVVPVTREKENVDPTEDVGRSTPGGEGGLRVAKRRRGRAPSSANKQMKVSDHLDHCDFPLLTFRQ